MSPDDKPICGAVSITEGGRTFVCVDPPHTGPGHHYRRASTDPEPKPDTLWLVEIHSDDWDYDEFESATVWAQDADEAEALVRNEVRAHYDATTHMPARTVMWVTDGQRLTVRPAPETGIALIHWHAG